MSAKFKSIVIMGTMDTKGPELAYIAQKVTQAGLQVSFNGRRGPQ